MKLILTPIAVLAFAFSAAMLIGAYAFEYLGGLPPCQMCYWQRWAHFAVLALAASHFVTRQSRLTGSLVVVALLVSALVAGFHAGVEYGWWDGPKSCTTGDIDLGAVNGASVFDDLSAPIDFVDCSKAPWSLFGVSMAGWNAILSFIAFLLTAALLPRIKRS